MARKQILDVVHDYFHGKLKTHGPVPAGLDYNSLESQTIRFDQLAKLFRDDGHFTLVDFGCGFGPFFDFLASRGLDFDYYGLDMIKEMVEQGLALHTGVSCFHCTCKASELPVCDYVIGGAIFNNKFDAANDTWTAHVIETLTEMDRLSLKGFAFNMLTSYSDLERQRPDLYYGDPLFFFDFCKRNFSKNVALLHDYGLYDFTILVRKEV